MKNIVTIAILIGIGWYASQRYQANVQDLQGEPTQPQETRNIKAKPTLPTYSQQFSCDGREYCSQMTSCAEAKYFLRNCPATKMDGNSDGVPCERQWCK